MTIWTEPAGVSVPRSHRYTLTGEPGRLLGEASVVVGEAGQEVVGVSEGLGDLSLVAAHRVAHEAEHRLLHDVPRLSAALVHAHPRADAAQDAHQLVAHHR